VAADGVGQQRCCVAALDFGGLGPDARLRTCAALMARLGSKSCLATAATRSMHGGGGFGESLALLRADDGDASRGRLVPWKHPSICSLSLHGTFFLGVKP
jgi:hypothetical protein